MNVAQVANEFVGALIMFIGVLTGFALTSVSKKKPEEDEDTKPND